jgi:hypothetical protein
MEYGKTNIVALTIRETPKITERETKIVNAKRTTILMLSHLDKEKRENSEGT